MFSQGAVEQGHERKLPDEQFDPFPSRRTIAAMAASAVRARSTVAGVSRAESGINTASKPAKPAMSWTPPAGREHTAAPESWSQLRGQILRKVAAAAARHAPMRTRGRELEGVAGA